MIFLYHRVMETSSVSSIQQAASVKPSGLKGAVYSVEHSDTLSVADGAKEAQKLARWVDTLKQMPDTPPSHFERGSHEPVLQEISKRLAEEVAAFLTESP